MNQSKINLQTLEKQAYHQFFEDGMIEILIGSVAILFGSMILLELFWLSAISGGVMLVLILSKKDLTAKRLGHASFIRKSTSEKSQLTFSLILGTLLLSTTLLILFGIGSFSPLSTNVKEWLLDNSLFIIAFLIACGSIFFGIFAGIHRFFAYALLIAAIPFIERFFEIHLGWPILLAGILLFLVGVLMLIRFTRKYPIIETGVNDDENE